MDKISILEIKAARISAPEKRENVSYELEQYQKIFVKEVEVSGEITALIRDLKAVNETLWDVEDAIRACEARQEFGDRFIQLARRVYRTNDRRAALKRKINTLCGSRIIEEKSYTPYEG